MQTDAQRLTTVEKASRRWQTRLTRAANMVAKLDKKRRRLQARMGPVGLTDLIGPAKDYDAIERKAAEIVADARVAVIKETNGLVPASKTLEDAMNIPAFLDRSDPLIAEKMTAARKQAEAAERKKMPLTGQAASDYINKRKKA